MYNLIKLSQKSHQIAPYTHDCFVTNLLLLFFRIVRCQSCLRRSAWSTCTRTSPRRCWATSRSESSTSTSRRRRSWWVAACSTSQSWTSSPTLKVRYGYCWRLAAGCCCCCCMFAVCKTFFCGFVLKFWMYDCVCVCVVAGTSEDKVRLFIIHLICGPDMSSVSASGGWAE